MCVRSGEKIWACLCYKKTHLYRIMLMGLCLHPQCPSWPNSHSGFYICDDVSLLPPILLIPIILDSLVFFYLSDLFSLYGFLYSQCYVPGMLIRSGFLASCKWQPNGQLPNVTYGGYSQQHPVIPVLLPSIVFSTSPSQWDTFYTWVILVSWRQVFGSL
jgi:hypothetical protein